MAIKPINAAAGTTRTWSAQEWHARNEMASAAAIRMRTEVRALYVDLSLPHRRLRGKSRQHVIVLGLCKDNTVGEYSVNALVEVMDETQVVRVASVRRVGVRAFDLTTVATTSNKAVTYQRPSLHDVITLVSYLVISGGLAVTL